MHESSHTTISPSSLPLIPPYGAIQQIFTAIGIVTKSPKSEKTPMVTTICDFEKQWHGVSFAQATVVAIADLTF